jgi:D-alanyl-D-alanine dipeptidase
MVTEAPRSKPPTLTSGPEGKPSELSSIGVMMILREGDLRSMIERAPRPRQQAWTNSRRARARGLAALLLAASCAPALRPPVETGKRAPDLVEVVTLDPGIHLDIRYATARNFVGRPVYKEARAFLQRPAAEALARAHRALAAKGYGIVVFDGYRPWSVTKLFWDVTPEDKKEFVADPSRGSRHNRGCAVDLSLYDLASGREVEMPSGYDEMTERAYPDYAGGPAAARARRDLLRAAMEAEGFTVYSSEWWHYDYKDWAQYPILDLPFSALTRPRRAGF